MFLYVYKYCCFLPSIIPLSNIKDVNNSYFISHYLSYKISKDECTAPKDFVFSSGERVSMFWVVVRLVVSF